MIEVAGLCKRYQDVVAVDGISFSVAEGEVVGFLGPNGAGKTTTMRVLVGSTPATSGKVVVAGADVFEEPLAVKRRAGYLPEVPPLYRDLDVSAYLGFVCRIKGMRRRRVDAEIERLCSACGLAEVRRRRIGNISRGYRQRVGLAQALANHPQVLVLDEPTTGLDPNQVAGIRSLIKELSKSRTVILSTHLLGEVMQICSRAIIMHRGRIVADEQMENLRAEGRSLEEVFHSLTMQ